MAVQPKLMTVEAFWDEYAGKPYELIEGEVVAVSPTGLLHMVVTAKAIAKLQSYVDENPIGIVGRAEGGFQLSPATLLGADAAFISNAKLAQVTDLDKFAPFAPDLAVEVVSPGNTATEIRQKVRLCLEAGTALVWIIYPDTREVVVHYPDGTAKTVPSGGAHDGGDVLPGFQAAVADLFSSPDVLGA